MEYLSQPLESQDNIPIRDPNTEIPNYLNSNSILNFPISPIQIPKTQSEENESKIELFKHGIVKNENLINLLNPNKKIQNEIINKEKSSTKIMDQNFLILENSPKLEEDEVVKQSLKGIPILEENIHIPFTESKFNSLTFELEISKQDQKNCLLKFFKKYNAEEAIAKITSHCGVELSIINNIQKQCYDGLVKFEKHEFSHYESYAKGQSKCKAKRNCCWFLLKKIIDEYFNNLVCTIILSHDKENFINCMDDQNVKEQI